MMKKSWHWELLCKQVFQQNLNDEMFSFYYVLLSKCIFHDYFLQWSQDYYTPLIHNLYRSRGYFEKTKHILKMLSHTSTESIRGVINLSKNLLHVILGQEATNFWTASEKNMTFWPVSDGPGSILGRRYHPQSLMVHHFTAPCPTKAYY